LPFEKALLRVEHLDISIQDKEGIKPIVQDITFQLSSGEMVALTGQSGCGKSVTVHTIVGMLEEPLKVTKGQIYYKDELISFTEEKKWHRFRREEIALLIQDSMNGLNPIRTVKKQMLETLNKKKWKRKEVERYLYSLLSEVGFSNPDQILSSYPFELSGGMRQRILLAMMICLKPKILIVDEPTTALDMINKEKVLTLLKKLQKKYELAIIIISHDQQSIKKYADRIIHITPKGVTV
jgi:peptide/nickel transport system ATP-binding protein